MRGVRKPFDRDLYNSCDERAKQAARMHLEAQGYKVVVPPENYGADLYSYLGEIKLSHEVEVSLNWQTGMYPFPMASVPARKHRLTTMVSGPLYFWMFCNDLNRAVVTPGHKLINMYLTEVPNRLVETGEYFYRVPIKWCRFLNTEEYNIAKEN